MEHHHETAQPVAPGRPANTAHHEERRLGGKVLRQTYALLAMPMLPTVLGTWIGVAIGETSAMSPGLSMFVFMAGAFGLIFAIQKYRNSAAAVPLLPGFTFFMGLMLSHMLGRSFGMVRQAGITQASPPKAPNRD